MGRPTKQGIDYFPVDVQFDDKVELFIAECGADGLGILITIWQLIYQNEGYYIQNNNDLILLIRRRVLSEVDTIKRCISLALSRGIFDEKLFNKFKILTSKAIQKRFIVAARKKKEVLINEKYFYECISTGGNVIYSAGNATKEKGEEKGEGEGKEEGNKKKIDSMKFRPDWIPIDLWQELIANRKFKKLQNTKLALTTFINSLEEGTKAGYTIEKCIGEYVSSSWHRFNYQWMEKHNGKNNGHIEPHGENTDWLS